MSPGPAPLEALAFLGGMGMDLVISDSVVKNRDAWRAFAAQTRPDQRTPGNWGAFLTGWLAHRDYVASLANRR